MSAPKVFVRFGFLLVIILSLLSSAAAAQSPNGDPPFAVELNRRSDSLSQLNPARELQAAICGGDWRFLGVVGYVVVAPGVNFDDPLYPQDSRDIRVIEGTSDVVIGDAGVRFNRVAGDYAERYNRLLLKRLREERNDINPCSAGAPRGHKPAGWRCARRAGLSAIRSVLGLSLKRRSSNSMPLMGAKREPHGISRLRLSQ